jgi:hypothetical protein
MTIIIAKKQLHAINTASLYEVEDRNLLKYFTSIILAKLIYAALLRNTKRSTNLYSRVVVGTDGLKH